MSNLLSRDITECLHLPKLLQISLKPPEIVVKRSQIAQTRLTTPHSASNRLSSPHIQSEPIQIVSKLLLLVSSLQNFI